MQNESRHRWGTAKDLTNLAFRGSEEVLGSPHNGNFLGIFELLARRDPILKELQDRIRIKTLKITI